MTRGSVRCLCFLLRRSKASRPSDCASRKSNGNRFRPSPRTLRGCSACNRHSRPRRAASRLSRATSEKPQPARDDPLPGSAPSTILAVAIAAPVFPAVTNPAARPSRTSRRPTRMDESRLARMASTALSSMVMTSLACTTSMGRRGGQAIARQFRAHHRLRSDQQYANAMMPRSQHCAFDLRLRRLVGPHRIQCDDARHGVEAGRISSLSSTSTTSRPL